MGSRPDTGAGSGGSVSPGAGRGGATSPAAGDVLAFAATLRGLRAGARNLSFRRMALMSGRVSHTTLHEAAAGTRFPSWQTTREFVQACGGDLAPWRARWEQVSGVQAVDAAAAPPPAGRPQPRVRVPGDASEFVRDVTIPDGTVVAVNQHFQKVWEIHNIGSVTWHDRYLQRMDAAAAPGTCQTPARVPVGHTSPGQHAYVSVNAVAPPTPGTCWVGWKMVDAAGHLLLPGYRPMYFLVHVVARPAPGG